MESCEDRYGMLPLVSETIVEQLLAEVEAFAQFMKHDPRGARRSTDDEIKWLKEYKDFLGSAIEAAVDSALENFDEKLSHKDYIELRYMLLKGLLIVMEMLNRASIGGGK